MHLGLIAMSGLRVENPELSNIGLTLPGFIERRSVIASLPSLGLLTLAGLTPTNMTTSYIDLQDFEVDDDLPGEFDAVAISSFSAQINTAYRLADRYRALGTKVILGGLHVTAMPDEALHHADAVVLGEGEVFWEKVCRDLIDGSLQKVYDARNHKFDLQNAPIPRYDLLDPSSYNRLTVQTQRGCPLRCEFCASSVLLSPKYKLKPIEKIVSEVQHIKKIWDRPFIELADDNTFVNKVHSKKLVRALADQRIKWFTETDVSVAEDQELLGMLGDSGCRQLLIGFESPSLQGLQNLELKADWKAKHLDIYAEAIRKIQGQGISVNGCFVLGLDGQDISIFKETFDFVVESGLSEVQITVQTPFPGTELYTRLQKSDRLLEDVYWEKCTLFDVTFLPSDMTVKDLEDGFRSLMQQLYDENLARIRKEQFISQIRDRKAQLRRMSG